MRPRILREVEDLKKKKRKNAFAAGGRCRGAGSMLRCSDAGPAAREERKGGQPWGKGKNPEVQDRNHRQVARRKRQEPQNQSIQSINQCGQSRVGKQEAGN
jgi:hypothetical protein